MTDQDDYLLQQHFSQITAQNPHTNKSQDVRASQLEQGI